MSVLSRDKIKELMQEPDYKSKLVVTPILTEKQFGPGSIDVRLGSSIIIPKRTFVASHDVTDREQASQVEKRVYDQIRMKYHSEFILHPNQLILAVTLEYLSIPVGIFCQVASRSSWGRLGLIVATAAAVQPGFKGCLTLELANLSDSPIALYPGLLVGQLVFFSVDPGKTGEGHLLPYQGRYECPTEAGLPQFFAERSNDSEMHFWGKKRT